MPYRHHDPVDISEMDRTRYDGHHSICQKLRDIFHMTENEEIKLELRVCMSMAKSMNQKLQNYKHVEEEKTRREVQCQQNQSL